MKLSFSFKNKEAKFEADVEKLIEKNIDSKDKRPVKKTRYQIKQEEKRKNEEQKHKHDLKMLYIYLAAMFVMFAFIFIMSMLENS